MKKIFYVLLLYITIFTHSSYGQTSNCDNTIGGQLTVNSSCVTSTFNSTNNTDYWNSAAGCNAADLDDAWAWFVATSTNTIITYNSGSDAVLTLFGSVCATNMTQLACSDNTSSGDETITYATTIGDTYHIRIQRWNSNNNMNGTICVYSPIPPDCNWSLCLVDSYGDGWNGGSIAVTVGGTLIGTWTLNTGSGPGCVDIPINIGDDIDLNYTAGSWSDENEYYLYDSYGNLAYSSGGGGAVPNDYVYTSADCDPVSVTPTDQDCLGAIPICGDSYSTILSYSGVGNISGEINGSTSCLASGERNDVWYIFTVQQDGDLMFTISPNNAADDYDWAVYDLTNSSCSDIATDPSIEVSCNWSGTAGDTGPDGSTAFSSQDDLGTPFNDGIPVLTGEVYVINVSNFSSTQDGYFIDFSMSSGVIVDVTPPELQTIVSAPSCGQDQITAWFTELVDTLTVEAGDFTVTGPGGPYSITYCSGTSGLDTDREFDLTLDAQLIAGGTYSLVFTGQVDDACGNSVVGNSLDFTVTGVSGSTLVNDGAVLCYDDAVGSATASASGGSGTYSYLWDTGASTATINNLVAGTYTVTVSDDVGVCYDIVDAIVNPANPLVATGTWAGTSNNDWNDCANWGGGRIPLSSTDVTIPGGCPNYPIFTVNTLVNGTTGICNSVRIQNGAEFSINNNKTLTIDNSNLLLETGGLLVVNDRIIIQNSGSITQTGGTIETSGNFTNDATFSSTGGEITFNGSSTQTLGGSQISTFNNVNINNDVELSINCNINGNLTMNSGDLNIVTYEIDLGTTGAIVNETAASRIKAEDGGGSPINGGFIKVTRNNPSGNVAGLGLDITPSSPLGNTTIYRGHDELPGTGSYAGNVSVLRNYEIESGAKGVITCDLTFNYFDSELNGHVDGTLVMFQEIQQTWNGVPGPIFWSPLSTMNNAGANTAIATTINNNLTTTKVTLGSDAMPLPVELINFNAKCNNSDILINWSTATEINNDYFTIESSNDGVTFEPIVIIDGKGNSNVLNEYSTNVDISINTLTYFRLKQTDFDGKYTYSNIITIICNTNEINEKVFNVFPNPASIDDNIYVEFKGFESNKEVLVVVIDILGQELYSKILLTDFDGSTVKAIDPSQSLPSGTYIIIGSSENSVYKKKLVIK